MFNIEFTYEIENDGKLPFLDVLVIRKDYEAETTVYCEVQTMTYIFTNSRVPPTA